MKNPSPSTSRRVFPSVGLLYAHLLLLLVLPGVTVFIHAWGYDQRSVGLVAYLLTPNSLGARRDAYSETWFLRIDARERWYLNGKEVSESQIPTVLSERKGGPCNCIVFLDVDQDLPYALAIHALDLVEGTGLRVVLLTPGTKKMRIP